MSDNSEPRQTQLYQHHVSAGAKMVPFAGYLMPLQYSGGIMQEHLHTRAKVGLFDVSHMGQITVTGENAPEWLETLLPTDIVGLKEGAQRYSFFTAESGGILDDLMVYRLRDEYCLVVNAANKDANVVFLEKNAIPGIGITLNEDRALLALQGPQAAAALESIAPGATTWASCKPHRSRSLTNLASLPAVATPAKMVLRSRSTGHLCLNSRARY